MLLLVSFSSPPSLASPLARFTRLRLGVLAHLDACYERVREAPAVKKGGTKLL